MRPLHEIIINGCLHEYKSGALSADDVGTIACSLIGNLILHLDEPARLRVIRDLEGQMLAQMALHEQPVAGHA